MIKDIFEKIIIVVIVVWGAVTIDRCNRVEVPVKEVVKVDTITVKEFVKDTVWLERVDTIKKVVTLGGVTDTVFVEIPIEGSKFIDTVYLKDERWRVDINTSGYGVVVDSVRLERVGVERRRRFSIGPTVGVGWNGDGISPYIGVGVTWRLFEV